MTQLQQQTGHIPLPEPNSVSEPFWEGCREGKLLFQRCLECGKANFDPAAACRNCLSTQLEWEESGGPFRDASDAARVRLETARMQHRTGSRGRGQPLLRSAACRVHPGRRTQRRVAGLPPECRLLVGEVERAFKPQAIAKP